jgi:spermidine synthase
LASRGATEQVIVEKDPKMYAFIQKTVEVLNFKHINVIKQDVFSFMQFNKEKYDFIFAGPPYALTTIDELPRLVFKQEMLNKGGWFVLEHTPRNDYKKFDHYKQERNYGTTIFSIFIQD